MIRYIYIKAAPGQTIYDIALQAYGDLSGLSVLLTDNQDKLSVVDMIEDQTFRIRKGFFTNKTVVDNFFITEKPVSI